MKKNLILVISTLFLATACTTSFGLGTGFGLGGSGVSVGTGVSVEKKIPTKKTPNKAKTTPKKQNVKNLTLYSFSYINIFSMNLLYYIFIFL